MDCADLRRLGEILSREVELLRDLQKVLGEERDVLVCGDVEAIRRSVEDQIRILEEIGRLEAERGEAVKRLNAAADGVELASLGDVIEAAPEGEAGSLKEARAALRQVLDAIGTVNRHNGMLIKQSLSYIDRTLKLVAGEDPASATYTHDGEIKCMAENKLIDHKA
jgi:flagellar biosynthesis/type III secretory pathway chaperone